MHSKREFITGIGLGLTAAAALTPALAQGMKKAAAPDDGPSGKTLPIRRAKTTKLFKTPGLWPNH